MTSPVRVRLRDRKLYTGPISKVFGVGAPWSVSVGVFGPKAERPHVAGEDEKGNKKAGKLTVEDIATAHEFGIGVPQRSFIAAWYDAHVQEAETLLYQLCQKAIAGAAARGIAIDDKVKRKILLRVGLLMQGGIQTFISSGQVKPPLAPATIARRNSGQSSSVPLLDTGQLRASITVAIDTGSGEGIAPEGEKDGFDLPKPKGPRAPKKRKAPTLKRRVQGLKKRVAKLAKRGVRVVAKVIKRAARRGAGARVAAKAKRSRGVKMSGRKPSMRGTL